MNSIAFGGGCELAMACDLRLAAESASFGQPEIDLGIIPGFGGTQRLPRLVGEAKALEMNLTGAPIDAYEAWRVGLANRVVPDHELLDTALTWARDLAGQAPLAVEQIKRVSAAGDLDQGIEAEKQAFAAVFGSEDAKEGISGIPGQAPGELQGQVGPARELAELLRSARSAVVLTGAGISVPSGIPDFRTPGTGIWANVDPMEVAHIDVWRRDPDRFWHFYGARFASLREVRAQPGPRGGGRAGAPRPDRRRDHPEHRPPAPRGGQQRGRGGARLDRVEPLPGVRHPRGAGPGGGAAGGRAGRARVPGLRDAAQARAWCCSARCCRWRPSPAPSGWPPAPT